MTITHHIASILLAAISLACNSSINQQNESSTYKSNISSVNGNYQIDTNAILNNTNLLRFTEELDKADLSEKKTVAEIPIFIKSFLENLTGDFSIANPGEEWRSGCMDPMEIDSTAQKTHINKSTGDTIITVAMKTKNVPSRQLIYFGLGKDIALMSYYTGGFGKSEHILIITFEKNKIVDFWCGTSLTDQTTKGDILKYMKENKDKEWGLNTNSIYL